MYIGKFIKIVIVSDKTIHKAFKSHITIYQQNPLDFFLHYFPKLYFNEKNVFIPIFKTNDYISTCSWKREG